MPRSKPWGWCAVPTHYLLEGDSLAEIQRRAAAEHGPDARLISAEKVTVGGIGRFMAKSHYEVVVEVPESAVPQQTATTSGQESAQRGSGLAALLDAADSAELRDSGLESPHTLAPPSRRGRRTRSMDSSEFAKVLDSQAFAIEPANGRRAAARVEEARKRSRTAVAAVSANLNQKTMVPTLLSGEGDLIVVVGPHTDALLASARITGGTYLRRNAGELAQDLDPIASSRRPITDRRGVLRARATAVEQDAALLVALALGPPEERAEQLALIPVLEADQLWAAVDATRKPEDTAAWVQPLAAVRPVDGVLCLNAGYTSTPHTVHALGLPVLEVGR